MLHAPFLQSLRLDPDKVRRDAYAFEKISFLRDDFELRFDSAVTIFVGENGTGKSTLIEAIAQACGFPAEGGSQHHRGAAPERNDDDEDTALAAALKLTWLPQVRNGFFFRAESFFNFASYLQRMGSASNLHARSHGEAFLETFLDRLHAGQRALYILDEPEVALSPQRQLAFLRILREWQVSRQVQAIIATHSPILMSLPDAALLSLDGGEIRPIALEDTEHYRITRSMITNRVGMLVDLFEDIG